MDDTALLQLWEGALALPPRRRAQWLAQAAGAPAGATLGACNAALLALRQRLFGSAIALRAACPACAAELEFGVDSAMLAASEGLRADDAYTLTLGDERVRFRAPRSDDIAALALAPAADSDDAARALFERCVVDAHAHGSAVPTGALSGALQRAVAERLDAIEPLAAIAIDIVCEGCCHAFSAPLDLASLLWTELRHRAEQVLADVAALANAYGWREADVLALSMARRSAYLQLAGAA